MATQTKEQGKRTPGPWEARWNETNKRCHLGHWYFVGHSSESPTQYENVHLRNKSGRAAANAEFIVRAVNSHEALVEALKAVRARFTAGKGYKDEFWPQVDAAIALAEGKD